MLLRFLCLTICALGLFSATSRAQILDIRLQSPEKMLSVHHTAFTLARPNSAPVQGRLNPEEHRELMKLVQQGGIWNLDRQYGIPSADRPTPTIITVRIDHRQAHFSVFNFNDAPQICRDLKAALDAQEEKLKSPKPGSK